MKTKLVQSSRTAHVGLALVLLATVGTAQAAETSPKRPAGSSTAQGIAPGIAMIGNALPLQARIEQRMREASGWTARSLVSDQRASTYLLQAPDARESRAAFADASGQPTRGVMALREFSFASTVTVRTTESGVIDHLLRNSTPPDVRVESVRPIGTDGHWSVVTVGSVAQAFALASALDPVPGIEGALVERSSPVVKNSFPTDPRVPLQWHLDNTANPGSDSGIRAVHEDLGYTGAGVAVAVYEGDDKTFQRDHPDLIGNFNASLSQPADAFEDDLQHATGVAGIIAAEGNNGIGGAGIAYNAQLVSLVATSTNNARSNIEAFLHRNDAIDIKNNSWSPNGPLLLGPALRDEDDNIIAAVFGASQDNAGWSSVDSEVGDALREAARQGQIFVVAAGNETISPLDRLTQGNAFQTDDMGQLFNLGFLDDDTFVQDNYGVFGGRTELNAFARTRDVFTVGAIGEDNVIQPGSTSGTNVFAVTYAEWAGRFMSTTGQEDGFLGGLCPAPSDDFTCSFGFTPAFFGSTVTGTSSAAASMSGIIALMLEANPGLTLRDIKFIIQQTADPFRITPTDGFPTIEDEFDDGNYVFAGGIPFSPDDFGNTFWQVNGADIPHSDFYGFGVVDAEAAVRMAESYSGSPELIILDTGIVPVEDGEVPDATYQEVAELSSIIVRDAGFWFDVLCIRPNIVIEDVELTLWATGTGSGDLAIEIESPSDTISPIGVPFYSGVDFVVPGIALEAARYNSLKHWGELSSGEWAIRVFDYVPDEVAPSGELDDSTPPMVVPHTIDGGAYGFPFFMGDLLKTPKVITQYRLRIFGHESGLPPAQVCAPINTGQCAADLNGDGSVDSADLLQFINWWLEGVVFADINGDGFIDTNDLLFFFQTWILQTGPCSRDPVTGGASGVVGGGKVIDI